MVNGRKGKVSPLLGGAYSRVLAVPVVNRIRDLGTDITTDLLVCRNFGSHRPLWGRTTILTSATILFLLGG